MTHQVVALSSTAWLVFKRHRLYCCLLCVSESVPVCVWGHSASLQREGEKGEIFSTLGLIRQRDHVQVFSLAPVEGPTLKATVIDWNLWNSLKIIRTQLSVTPSWPRLYAKVYWACRPCSLHGNRCKALISVGEATQECFLCVVNFVHLRQLPASQWI